MTMTKKEMYAQIINIVSNSEIATIMEKDYQRLMEEIRISIESTGENNINPKNRIQASANDVIAFCEHEIELLNKKGTGSNKPTKVQLENETYKQAILDTFAALNRPVTISELTAECEAIASLTNQRVSALITQLKNAGLVVRTEIKKKAYFALNNGEIEGE